MIEFSPPTPKSLEEKTEAAKSEIVKLAENPSMLFNCAQKMNVPVDDRDDVISEAFANMWEGKQSWRGEAFRPWAFSVAHNGIVDYFRDSQRIRGVVSLDEVVFDNDGTTSSVEEAV